MGVHCINPKSKDFLNISKRLNISPANLEDIIHKYQYENDTDEYPSDDYIKAALEGTRTTMSQEQADLWERYYQKPKRFKTLQELNRAKQNALKFFRKEAISEYVDADGNYVLKVAKAKNTRQLFYSKSPNLRQQFIEEAKSKLRDYYRQLVIPTNTEQEYTKALAVKRKMDKRIFYSPNNSDDLDSQRQREIASVIENIKKEIPSYLLKNIRQIVLHNGGIKLQIDLNPESLIKESYIDSVINSWIDDMSNDSILNEAERIDLAETSEAYYINPKKKQEILSQIKKRAKLNTQEEINEAIDFLETLENSPELNLYVSTCIQWLKTDSILLPRDNEKLLTLFQSARKLKLDVQKYKNPIELMIAVANAKSGEVEQGTKVNPEAISQLTFNTIITNSKGEKLYVYDVEDSPSGQEAVCQMLADASPKKEGTVISNSPWCLSTFNYNKDTGKATPTESARRYWNTYSRGKRQIALLNNETPIAFNSSSSNKDEWWDFYDGQYNSFKGYSNLKSVDTSSAKKVYKKSIQHQDGLQVIRLGDYAYDILRNIIMRKIYTNSTGFTVDKSNAGLNITLNDYHRQRYMFLKNYHANNYSLRTFRLRTRNYGIFIDFFDNNRIRTIGINYRTKKGKYKINYNFPFKGSIIEQAVQEAVAFMDKHKSDSIAEFNSTNIAQAKEIANKLLNNDDIFNSIKEYSEELTRKEEEKKEQEQQEPVKQPSAEIQEALQTNNQRLQEINTRQAVQEYLVDNEEQANQAQAQEYNIEDQGEETDTQETTQSTVSAVEEREYTTDEETKKTLEEVNKKTKKKFSIKDLLRLSKLLKERDVKDLYNEAIGQRVNSELETILKDILKEYHFEAWEGDLKEIFGNDILGATDFINKIIYLAQSKDRNAITMPEEFAHSFIKLMGARYRKQTYTTPEGEVKQSRGLHPENKEYSELRDLVEQTSLYKQVYDLYSKDKQYQFPNGTPNTIKIKEEAVGQALAAILTNRYKAKTEAEANWYKRLKLWFNDVLNAIAARLQPNAERKLRRRMTKIADSILDGSYREKYLDKFDSSKFQLLDYNETIQNMTQRDNGYTLQLLKDISSLGGVVTGSLSYRAQGTVYRKGQDLIHDIDVIVPESKSRLSARHPTFKRYNSTPLQNRWTQDKLIEVAKETDYYQKLKDKYPDLDIISSYVSQDNKLITNAIICNNQELKTKFINMEGDFNSRMNKLTQEERDQIRLVDLFFELDDKITDQTFLDTENDINLANYGVSFEEKMKFARAKDIFDYQKFNPFSRMRPVDTSNMSLMFQKTPDQYEKELQDILAKAPRDSQGRLLAPNGKPSNLTERQYAQVRTKEFKKWFGDWEKEYTPPIQYDLSTWERTGKYVDVLEKDFLGNNYSASKEILSHPIERKEPTKEDPFGFNSAGVSKAIKIGTLVNRSNTLNGICQFTAQRIQAFLKDRYGINTYINIISAKSPVTGKPITHYVVVLSIDGKPYIYDMPQTEFITTNGNTFNVGNKEYKEAVITKEYTPRLIPITKESLLKNYGDSNDIQISVIENTAKLSDNIKSSDIETSYIPAYSPDVSKVVDENGEPLVVYHGNRTDNKITTFDLSKKGVEHKERAISGFWFITDENIAKDVYAVIPESKGRGMEHLKYGEIISVFLNIKNPVITEQQGIKVSDTTYGKFTTAKEKLNDFIDRSKNLETKDTDGYILTMIDSDDRTDDFVSKQIQLVVFNPNQIKSATDNTGAFSSDNDDIYDSQTQQQQAQEVFSTRQEMLNTMIQDADGFIGEVSQSPYTKVGNKFVIKNSTEVEKAVNYISKRGVPKDRRSSLLSEKSIKFLTEDKDNTSYYNVGYNSGDPSIMAVTNRELFDENYTPKTIMFLRDQGRLDEDIIKTQLEQFKDTSTFLVDASDTKAIEFFDKNGYNYKVYQVGQQQSQTQQQQQQNTQPMVTKIISGGQTGVDTIGLQVARELGIETGGTAPKGFLRERGIDDEDISSYNLTEITDEEQADYTERKGKSDPYTGRTELNVRNSDGTVYFYTSDDKAGMLATKRSAEDWNKPFITNPTTEQLKQWLIDNNIKTLNVAGNRGSKLDKNNNVAKILREALTNNPKQKQEEKRDPYRERQQEITRQLDALQESSLMTNIEIREIAEQVVYWISDHITELQENPELAVKIYGDTVKNLNTQEASRIEIVNAIGLDNIKEMCKQKFSPKNARYTKISTIRKANLIIDNWDAIMQLASDVFTDIEKFSITETVVADKVVSQTNENLNNNQDNFNAEEQNDEESLLETHGNLQEHWQTKANTIDIMDSMSQLMHRAIAQCYQLEEVSRDENNKPVYDKVKSEFGINLRVKPREVTGSLLRWCQGCLNIKDVIANLKAKESANPWVSQIITKLEDNSGNESDFQSQFFGVFVKPFMSYSIVKIDEDGNYISQVVNKNPALKEAVKGITTLYKIGEHPMFKSNGAVNKETFQQFSEAMKELANLDLEKNKDKIVHNLGFMYNALGFSITDDLVSQILDEDTYKMLTTQFGYIHKSLYDNQNIANPKDYEPLKFKGKGSFLGTLNNVLKPITNTLEDTAVSAFYDNGNMYQSYVIPSYMTKLMSKFHLDGEKFDQFITNEYGKYDWFKEHNSRDIERGWKLPILRELVTNPKAREVFDHKVQLTFNKHQYMKKMDDTEVTLAILAEYWAETTRSTQGSNRIPAWFRVPMLSNKPSAEYIKFYSERGINYQDVITDNVYKIFLQEMSRIQTVMMRNYGKQDPEFIKNFDKNGKKFNFVDFMNEYLTGDSKNSQLGKLIQSKLNGQKLNSQEELMFSDLAKQAIKEALTEKAESIVNNFERKGIFEGAKKIEGIDKDNIREELINFAWNDTYMSMNILQLTITDIAYYKDAEDLQKRLAQIHAPGIRANQYATDYQGNPVSDGKLRTIYLKDFDNFISNIIDNVSVVFDRKIKNAKTEEEKQGYTVLKESIVEQFKNINVADAQGYSSPTSYRKKALLFGKWSKEAEDIYRKLISGEYTYSDLKTAFQPLKPFVYTQIEKSSNVNSDEAPMTNLKVGVQNKNSEYLLIMADALLQGEDTGKPNLLRALYSVMEESSIDVKETTLSNGKKQRIRTPRIDGLDTVQFESTVKAGLRGAIDINQFAYDEDGERKAKEYIESLIGKNGAYNETYVDEIPVEDYCLQQEIPAHFRGHEQAHGSQIRAITPSDLESTDAQGNPITYNVEGKELTAEQFKTEYEKTIAANIEDSIETLTKELNLGPEATQVDKNRALEKILRREILSSPRYGVDLLQACTLNEEGQFRIPKGDPIQSKRIEQLLNSIIKNRVNKQEIAGGPVVQVSNFGTSRELNIRFKAKGGGLLMTRKEFEKSPLAKKVTATSQTDKFNARYGKTSKTMTYEQYIEENQAGIAYFEVFAPIYLNDIFEKFQNPDGSIDMKAIEELNPDLLKMIGYRIPTEDKYSCAPLKIVGFLPREAGDTIMLPNDITLLTGSDFDIDKEYLMRKDIPITLRDKKDIFDDMFQHFTANKNLSKETIKDIKNAINLFLNNPNPKLLDFSKSQDRVLWTYYKKFAYKAEAPTEGRTYRNNKIVDMTWEVLTHESNADKILNPGGFEPQKKMGYLISAYRNPANTKSWEELVAISKQPKGIDKLKELCYTEKNLCYIDTHIQFYKQNSAAGSLIGTFAVHKTAHAILESDGFKIDIESICPPFVIDGMEFNNRLSVDPRYDRKGNLIGKTLGSLVASAADAVKDPILNLMNINSNTSNVLNTLIRLGMDFDTAALFLSQTAITNVLEEYSRRNITEYTSLNKVIKERCEELESDYSIDETLLTQEPITMDELISGLNPNLDNIDPKTEYRILKAFNNLQNIGSAMRSLTRVTRFNSVSSAVGPLIIDNLITEHQLENFSEKILYGGEPCGIEKVYQLHPQLMQFAKTLDIARDLMLDMPTNSNGFRYLLGASKSYKEVFYGDRKLLSQLSDFYQSYALMASGVINSSELENYIKDFPAQFIKNYQQKYKSNPLINAIKADVTSTGTAILKVDTTGLDQKAKDILSMAWIDLHKQDPELSTKLFIYNLFRGGVGFNPKTFTQLAPTYVKERIPNYIATYRKLPQVLNALVLDQFIRNNWNNNKLVPTKKVGLKAMENNPNTFEVLGDEATEEMKEVLYFKTKDSKGNYTLWRQTSGGANAIIVTYEKIQPLGNNGEYIEMSTTNIKESLDAKQTKELFEKMDNDIPESTTETQEETIEYTDQQIEDILYRAIETGNNITTREQAIQKVQDYKNFSEEKQKKYEKSMRIFLNNALNKLGITVEEDLVNKVYNKMCK